ncbi:hypothetical protein [Amphritea sp.]|uniref:acyltransferase n=1 Tax=Amphritea sp. TaxID=1872502 RepID=UPI0025C28525|nr:hypothetical protein [Amphritea sp.]
MMSFNGLDLRVDEGNFIEIDADCNFQTSRIYIQGTGNKVKISKALLHQTLFINISGNDKEIVVSESKKNINNLKIVSIRGECQKVLIGRDFSCGGCEIQMNDGYETLTIGDDCLFSWGIKMRTSDGHSVIDLETGNAINLPKNITIGSHVWVGEDVKFLKGSIIPCNTIVGGFSVVTKAFFSENSVIAGFPAKVVKSNVGWDRQMPYEYNRVKS